MNDTAPPKARRWLRLVLIVVPSAFASALIAAALWAVSSLPQLTGSIAVSELNGDVRVLRDERGVPHIFADSEWDAYVALGFCHAQDRFWQMETMRRLGSGRLSEVFGERTLAIDKWMRTLGLYRLAGEEFEQMSAPAKEALSAYVAGVNQWLATSHSLPAVEFTVFRYDPEPWKPADSLVWGKIMATRLGGNHRREILRARLTSRLEPEQIRQLWPGYPKDAPVSISERSPGTPDRQWTRLFAGLSNLSPWPDGHPRGASNAWAVGSERTDTEKPLLANDPHLGFSTPILWYLARIVTPDWQMTGATVPGVPFHILGHNGRIAWGITSTQSDIEDLFVEKVDPHSADRYLEPEGSAAFATETAVIDVKDGPSQSMIIRRTRHGPVISDLRRGLERLTGQNHVIALAATYLEPEDRTAEAFYGAARAGNWDTFRAALKNFGAPQQNFVFADVSGDIGFIAPGRVPVRRGGFGTVPSVGWAGETDWLGFIPFDDLPAVHGPDSGRIVNANNRIVGASYPYFISSDWEEPFRAARIVELIDGKSSHSFTSMREIQLDIVSEMAREMLPKMLSQLGEVDPVDRPIAASLKAWDYRMGRERSEPLVFSMWFRELNKAVYADELGDLSGSYLGLRPGFIDFSLSKAPGWCDDVETEPVESCGDMIRRSFASAVERLRGNHGRDPAKWRWGLEHEARFEHPVLASVPGVGRLFNLITPTHGGNYTVNRGASRINDETSPFSHVHGAGYRAVYDLGNLADSRFMIATGQSGNALSPHYNDLLSSWRDGRYIRLDATEQQLIESGAKVLTLKPGEPKQ